MRIAETEKDHRESAEGVKELSHVVIYLDDILVKKTLKIIFKPLISLELDDSC